VNLVKKVAKSDLDSDSSIRLRFVLDCILSSTAFCQALRFAYLKTIYCVLLRKNSTKIKTALRFVSVPEHTIIETPTNMSLENKAHFLAEKEAIHLILTRIGDDIYSTVDAYQTAQEMWEAIERLQQGQHSISLTTLAGMVKQYYNEVNELRAEKLARNANPLALVANAQASQDQYYKSSRSHKSSAPSPKPSIPSRSHTSTRHKGKEIAKPITLTSEIASEEDSDTEQAQKDKDMQKNLALIAKYFKKIYKPTNNNLRTSSNSKNKNVDTTSRKPKRVKDFAYHKEKMLLCKQAEQDVPLQAEQYDWLADTNEEVDEQELEAHYSYMANIQEVPTADSGTDSEPMEQNEQNDVGSDDERVALANLIANLKLDVDENKKIQKQLKKTKQAEFKKYKAFNDRTVDYDKLECKLNEALGQLAHKDTVIRECLKTKAYELLVVKEKHDELKKQSLLTKLHYEGLVKQKIKQEMHVDLKYVESLEKEIDELKYDKAKFSDMYDEILQECVSKEANRHLFSDSLERKYFPKTKSVPKTNVSGGLSKPVTTQTLPQAAMKAVSNTNVLKPGMYRIDNRTTYTRAPQLPQIVRNTNLHVSTSIGVNHKPAISRPQLKSDQSKDKVLPNNSQVKVKKTQVEVHSKIPSVSNKMKSVTACKDSLNSKTLNANAVCATCNKCLVDSNHSTCVTKMLNFVHASTKKPTVVPIITRKPKSQANKWITTPNKKKVKATPTQAWFWHRRLAHLNFEYINSLLKKDIVIGLPNLKYVKYQLCSSCELSKAKRMSFKSKAVSSLKGWLNLLHMDLCGPMRVASINGKKYILVIVDDYSRYTWTLFLHSKDEAPEVLKDFLTMILRNLQALVFVVRTDRGTEFLNKTLNALFKEEAIEHQTLTARTPEQNGDVKRKNHTLVEVARTMLSAL
nr:retrovirus-related Pol polyprotein from transposon TNT 1-94 [Tanacetum cinerariifolium]